MRGREESRERERGHECNRRFMRERSASLWHCVGRGECEGGSEREREERERERRWSSVSEIVKSGCACVLEGILRGKI